MIQVLRQTGVSRYDKFFKFLEYKIEYLKENMKVINDTIEPLAISSINENVTIQKKDNEITLRNSSYDVICKIQEV